MWITLELTLIERIKKEERTIHSTASRMNKTCRNVSYINYTHMSSFLVGSLWIANGVKCLFHVPSLQQFVFPLFFLFFVRWKKKVHIFLGFALNYSKRRNEIMDKLPTLYYVNGFDTFSKRTSRMRPDSKFSIKIFSFTLPMEKEEEMKRK